MAEFIKESDIIQDLMFLITDYQSFERAKKKYDFIMIKFEEIFNKENLIFMDEKVVEIYLFNKYAPIALILKGCKQIFPKDLDLETRKEMQKLLDPLEKEVVSEYDYYSVM